MSLVVLCEEPGILRVILIVKYLIRILFIIIPFILMYKIMKDLFIYMLNPRKETMSEVLSKNSKRFIAAFAIFFVPTIVNYAMTFVNYDDSVIKSCENNATVTKIKELEAAKEKEINDKLGGTTNLGDIVINLKTKSDEDNSSSDDPSQAVSDGKESDLITNDTFKLKKVRISVANYKKFNSASIVITDNQGKSLSSSDYTFESSNKGILSVTEDGKLVPHFGGVTNVIVTSKSDPSKKASANVTVVQTLYTNVKLTKNVVGKSLITGKDVSLNAGTTGAYNGLVKKIKHPYPLGDTIKVGNDYIAVDASNVKPYSYYIADVYSQEFAEDFVNMAGFKSDTNYLFWTNAGSQVLYIFKGSAGNWKLFKQFEISTGDALGFENSDGGGSTGVHLSSYKVGWLAKEGYSVPVVWKDNGRNGSNPWHIGGGQRYPKSHGCTRFNTDDLKYIVSIHSQIKGSRIVDF